MSNKTGLKLSYNENDHLCRGQWEENDEFVWYYRIKVENVSDRKLSNCYGQVAYYKSDGSLIESSKRLKWAEIGFIPTDINPHSQPLFLDVLKKKETEDFPRLCVKQYQELLENYYFFEITVSCHEDSGVKFFQMDYNKSTNLINLKQIERFPTNFNNMGSTPIIKPPKTGDYERYPLIMPATKTTPEDLGNHNYIHRDVGSDYQFQIPVTEINLTENSNRISVKQSSNSISNQYPKRPKQHIIDEQGQLLLKARFPKEWLVIFERKDYGTDLTVEIPVNGEMKANIFKGQLKTHEKVTIKSNSTISQPVKYTSWNYWKKHQAPFFLFVADLSKKRVYWLNVKKTEIPKKPNQEKTSVSIPVNNDLSNEESLSELINDVFEELNITVPQVKTENSEVLEDFREDSEQLDNKNVDMLNKRLLKYLKKIQNAEIPNLGDLHRILKIFENAPKLIYTLFKETLLHLIQVLRDKFESNLYESDEIPIKILEIFTYFKWDDKFIREEFKRLFYQKLMLDIETLGWDSNSTHQPYLLPRKIYSLRLIQEIEPVITVDIIKDMINWTNYGVKWYFDYIKFDNLTLDQAEDLWDYYNQNIPEWNEKSVTLGLVKEKLDEVIEKKSKINISPNSSGFEG